MLRCYRPGGLVVVLLLALGAAGQAITIHPDLIRRLRDEGRWEETLALLEDARSRGVGTNPAIALAGGPRATVGDRQAPVILVDFTDNQANQTLHPPGHYDMLLFSLGQFPTGSMRDFYLENSYGQFDVTGTVTSWYRMPQLYTYYTDGEYGFGAYPRNAQRLAEDAIAAADAAVDFSQFDNDGPDGIPNSGDDDGYVDGIFVVFAGSFTGDPNQIWPHAWSTSYPVPVDGVYAWGYSMEPEDGVIGVFCHEFGHILGLPDLYDYGYDAAGVGVWDLMGWGIYGGDLGHEERPIHLSAWSKIELGWVTPTVLSKTAGIQFADQVEENPVAYKLYTGSLPSAEYFLLENRERVGFDGTLPRAGLLIWHIDDNVYSNERQCCGSCYLHYLVALEQSDGLCQLESFANYGDFRDPWQCLNATAFTDVSIPNSRRYSGQSTGISVTEISCSGPQMSFRVGPMVADLSMTLLTPQVAPGGRLRYEGTLRNATAQAQTVVVLANAYLPDGTPYPGNPVLGPQTVTLAPNQVRSGQGGHRVPLGTPAGVYRYEVRVEDTSGTILLDLDDFPFEVTGTALAGGDAAEPWPVEGDLWLATASGAGGRVGAGSAVSLQAPNPLSPPGAIQFTVPPGGEPLGVALRVYDLRGHLVRTLLEERLPAGPHQARWDGRDGTGKNVSPGIYFYYLVAGEQSLVRRMTLTR